MSEYTHVFTVLLEVQSYSEFVQSKGRRSCAFGGIRVSPKNLLFQVFNFFLKNKQFIKFLELFGWLYKLFQYCINLRKI